MQEIQDRQKKIIQVSFVGILTNLLLVAIKLVAGLLSNSLALILDAINNLTDSLSSLITIIGVKLASKKPDYKHPLGYGRIEYLSSLGVACLVLYAGVTSIVESIKKIFHPETPSYTTVTIVIIVIGVIAKLLLGNYFLKEGKKTNSTSLMGSGEDAKGDALLSASVLVSVIAMYVFHFSIEAYVGIVIAGFIVKAGVEMLLETIDDLLGHAYDTKLTHDIKEYVEDIDPMIKGAYDLILHNYGPDHTIGSLHISIDDTLTAEDIDALSRKIGAQVYAKFDVLLVGIGIYSYNTKDDEACAIRSKVTDIAMRHEGVLQVHGFYADTKEKKMSLDMIIDWHVNDRDNLYHHILKDIQQAYPDYAISANLDINV